MTYSAQAQFIEAPVPPERRDSTAATRQWALDRLHDPLALADLARHAGTSVRTFVRHVTDPPIDDVAGRVGFATGASLRHHLHTAIGVSPLTYRRTFRAGAHGR